jgi:putative acetyltransferase
MKDHVSTRVSAGTDIEPILTLYPIVFPEEDLTPLVRALLADPVAVHSCVAVEDEQIIGHAAWTRCTVAAQDEHVALLGPIAVHPDKQRNGVGTALVQNCFEELRAASIPVVFVLGDSAYYSRFGFKPERNVAPPYPLPESWRDAWQSLSLAGATHDLHGTLSVPEPWQHRELWTE